MPGETKPLRRNSIVCKKLGSETMLYDQGRGCFHILNPTALVVWELCDGEHTLKDMEKALRHRFKPAEGADIVTDLSRVISRFAGEGLLEGET